MSCVAYRSMLEHLQIFGLNFEAHEQHQVISARLNGQHGPVDLGILVGEQDKLLKVYSTANVLVPTGSRAAVVEAITRANYGLKFGKFELDLDSGDLRFHASTAIDPKSPLGAETAGRIVVIALAMLEQYWPAVLSVIYGNQSPQEAVQHVEMLQ